MSSSYPHYASVLGSSPSTATLRQPTLEQLIGRAHSHPRPRSPSGSRDRATTARLSPAASEDVLSDLDEESGLLLSTSPSAAAAASYGATAGGGNGHGPACQCRPSNGAIYRGRRSSVPTEGELRGREHVHVEGKLPLLAPQLLTADQGGETALEEEERLLGHPGGGDHGVADSGERDWKAAVRAEAKILAFTTLPILFTQVAEYSIAMVSVISVGHLSSGPNELAAASLASMTASVSCFSILQGIASTLDTLLPAAWTSSDPSRVGLWTMRVAVLSLGATLPILQIWLNAESLLLFLKQDAEVAHMAAIYLRSLSIGIPGYALNCILKKYFQAQGKMNVPTLVILIVAPFNCALNWLLVWGPIPAVRLGFPGAPLATALSYDLEALLFISYAVLSSDKRAWPGFSFKQAFSKLGTCGTLGLAGIGMTAAEWWSWEVVTLAASLLGPTALAAESILLITCSITYQAPLSLSIATSVRAGNLLGAGRGWEAMWASRVALGLAVLLAGCNSTILLSIRYSWARLFNSDPEVVRMVAELIPWLAFFQLSDGLTGVANGILRVLGRQSIGATIGATSYYAVGLPIGFYLCFRRELGLAGLWIGLSLALLYSAVCVNWIVARADWEHEVVKAQDRLGVHDATDDEGRRPLLADVEEEDDAAGENA